MLISVLFSENSRIREVSRISGAGDSSGVKCQVSSVKCQVSSDLLGVDLDILLEVVPVQVEHKVMHEVVSVDDQRKLIRQLGLLQEVLDPLRSVAVGLAADPFDLLDLTGLAGRLDVLEIDLGVLGEVDDAAKEVEETLEALEALEEVDEAFGGELLVVLGGDLDTDLEVLADVGLQHGTRGCPPPTGSRRS